jgi:dGTPase
MGNREMNARLPRIEYTAQDWERSNPEIAKADEERSPFEIDRARIIHSAAFRRLQGKTQVFAPGLDDFLRTRLTHSVEAAQIGKGLALRLGADPDLIEAVCLAHDLGHPPFGHTGEDALNRCMRDFGGFEGNAQNLRSICKLSTKFMEYDGLNLTRATIDGILKYKLPYTPGRNKFYYGDNQPLVDWACRYGDTTARSFECQIMDWADEIAYSVHDLEDGMKVGMITTNRLLYTPGIRESLGEEHLEWVLEHVGFVEKQTAARDRKAARKVLTSLLISEFINASSREEVEVSPETSVRYRYRLKIDKKQSQRCSVLKKVMFRLIVEDARVAIHENKAERIIEGLFKVFSALEPKTAFLFPDDFRDEWLQAQTEDERVRIACDYIAGMTDAYAEAIYARLYLP